MKFISLNLTGDSFAPGSFDGNKQPLDVTFVRSNITYIPESSFKSVLSNNQTEIELELSYIDCEDCRNLWLINDRKDKQLIGARCIGKIWKKLFDQDIQVKLKNKCKSIFNL